MIEALCQLGLDDLRQLASALRSGRLIPPFTKLALRRYVVDTLAEEVEGSFRQLAADGLNADQIASMLDLLAHDRSRYATPDDLIDLVWTGPEAGGIANRDTSVVVRELFQAARHSVVIAGYAIYQGHIVFRTLAERMDREEGLKVTMFLDVRRPLADTLSPVEVVRHFAARFRSQEWPGRRLPEVYYDPRSLETDPAKRASLHAKCVIVDAETALISSANFTAAAQLRNIEVGVLVRSRPLSRRLVLHFETLAAQAILRKLPLD